MLSGWICLDKPAGISSNFAMVKVRRLLGEKTGYVGTLDPFATGVLPIAVGKARKFIQFLENDSKSYEFTVIYGQTTDTLDVTGNFIGETNLIPTERQIISSIPKFLGEITQIPPKFSAIKINGQRACDLVRRNKDVDIPSRNVHIFDLKLLKFNGNEARFYVHCSKGTYVRTLADDMAKFMGTLCYVKELRRLHSGFFTLKHTITLENLFKIVDTTDLVSSMISIESPLDDIPALYLERSYCTKLQNGVGITVDNCAVQSSYVRLFDSEQRLFKGVCYVSADGEVTAVKMCLD